MTLPFPVLQNNPLLHSTEGWAHQSEAALTTAQIPEIEIENICREHASNQTPRPNRSKSSAVRVIDNLEVDRLREEDAAKEEEKRQGKLLGLQAAGVGAGVVVGWVGGVVR